MSSEANRSPRLEPKWLRLRGTISTEVTSRNIPTKAGWPALREVILFPAQPGTLGGLGTEFEPMGGTNGQQLEAKSTTLARSPCRQLQPASGREDIAPVRLACNSHLCLSKMP